MQLHINAVEASELPKTEFLSAPDTFLSLQLTGQSSIQKTTVIENTLNPIWNQEFHFQVADLKNQILVGIIEARNVVAENVRLGSFEIPLNSLRIGEITDRWYKILSAPGLKQGSTIRIVLQVAPSGHPAFQPYPIMPQPMMMNVAQQRMYQQTYPQRF